MQAELKGQSFESKSLNGFFSSWGGLFFIDNEQINPTEEQIRALHSDFMCSGIALLAEHNSNYFYDL